MIAAKILALVVILGLALFVGFVIDGVLQLRRQDITSRLSARGKRHVTTTLNMKHAARIMADPYQGPVPELVPPISSAVRTEHVLAEMRAKVAELNARTDELAVETERMRRERVDADLQRHVAEVQEQRERALAGREAGAA